MNDLSSIYTVDAMAGGFCAGAFNNYLHQGLDYRNDGACKDFLPGTLAGRINAVKYHLSMNGADLALLT